MIEINNLTSILVNEEFLKGVAKKVLEGENREKDVSIALIGEGRMRKLNKKYRSKNRTTNVLAFSQNGEFPVTLKNKLGIGEVIICLRTVKKEAIKYNFTFEKELARVLIHGLLHLLGYDHEKGGEEEKRMEKREEYYLSQIN